MLYQHDGSTAILAPSVFTCLPLPGKAKGVAQGVSGTEIGRTASDG